jgi:hypothetical protein
MEIAINIQVQITRLKTPISPSDITRKLFKIKIPIIIHISKKLRSLLRDLSGIIVMKIYKKTIKISQIHKPLIKLYRFLIQK